MRNEGEEMRMWMKSESLRRKITKFSGFKQKGVVGKGKIIKPLRKSSQPLKFVEESKILLVRGNSLPLPSRELWQ